MDKAELSRLVHEGEVFERQTFDGLDLSNADLGGAVFSDCSLRGADLRGAKLSEGILSSCDLSEAKLDEALLRHTTFFRIKGVGLSLTGARMVATTFGESDLEGATAAGADATVARILKTRLDRASFAGANMDRA